MENTRKKKYIYPLMLFVFFCLIPHIVMSLPNFRQGIDYDTRTMEIGYTISRIYFWCVWILMPLAGGAIALWQVRKEGKFSPVLVLEAAVAMLTFLPRTDPGHVPALSVSVLIILIIECFPLLQRFEAGKTGNRFLRGMAQYWDYYALIFFWTVGILVIMQIGGYYLSLWHERIAAPFVLFHIPFTMYIVAGFRPEGTKPTAGGVAGILLLMLLSCFLSATAYLRLLWKTNVICVLLAYAVLLGKEALTLRKFKRESA